MPTCRLRHHPGSSYGPQLGSTASSAPLVAPPGANPLGPGVSPAVKTRPGSPLWGTAPPRLPGHRQALPLSGGPDAAQHHSHLLSEADSSTQLNSPREILSGPPSRLRPSAHVRRRLTASREAPAPDEGTGRRPSP
ncbi:hypothetical protein NDU88_005820 [Pleurodeles waltl]|uniref:Uncharacterized protein n=1 Tax=Pleurodeles waltl TaxID=8319 RepID=A0AAV7LQ53_PLEWA|nr:hypothetical protein NDU88_005820 [Pleurodeles waltl]